MRQLQVCILGTPRVLVDGCAIKLPGLLQRALLARLAIAGEHGVPRNQLVSALWSTQPGTDTGPLRVLVRRVRTALGEAGDVIETTSDGYRLAPGITVDVFELRSVTDAARALAPSDQRGALRILHELRDFTVSGSALNGPQVDRAFEGLEDFPFTRDVGAFAADVVRDATVLWSRLIADEQPALAEHPLATLAVEHPLDEAIAAMRMEVLMRLGRPSEALAVAQQLRADLRELGLVPSAEVQQRELDVLQVEPKVDATSGRTRRLDRVAQALDHLERGVGATITVHGMAGSGKTHFVHELVDLATGRGIATTILRASEFLQQQPFHVFRSSTDGNGRSVAFEPAAALRLVDAAGAVSADDPAANRFAVANELTTQLRTLPPQFVVVEDLHWSDPASLSVLQALIEASAGQPLLLVCTGRPTDSWSDQLGSNPRLALSLAPLTNDESTALAATTVGGHLSANLAGVVELCQGNPLLILEYLRGLEIEGRLVRNEGVVDCTGQTAPETVRSLIVRRVRSLDRAAADLVAQASVLGMDCDVDLLARIGQVDPIQVVESLSLAAGLGLVSVESGHVRFPHDQIRDAVYDDLGPAEQSRMHRLAAGVLGEKGSSVVASAAHMLLASGDSDQSDVELLREAAARVTAFDPRASISFLDHALQSPTDVDTRFLLQRAKLEALIVNRELQEATSLVDMLVKAERPEAAQLRLRLAGLMLLQNELAPAVTVLSELTKTVVAESLVGAQAQALTSLALLLQLDMSGAAATATSALEVGRSLQDPVSQSLAHGVLGRGASMAHRYVDGLSHCRLAAEFAEADESGEAMLYSPWFFAGLGALDMDDDAVVQTAIERGRAANERYGITWSESLYCALEAASAYRAGRADQAQQASIRALAIEERSSQHVTTAWVGALLALLAIRRGDWGLAERYCSNAEVAAEAGAALGIDFVVLARARLQDHRGDTAAAHQTLKGAWEFFDLVQVHSCKPVIAATLADLSVRCADADTALAVSGEMETVRANGATPALQAVSQLVRAIHDLDTEGIWTASRQLGHAGRPHESADCARFVR